MQSVGVVRLGILHHRAALILQFSFLNHVHYFVLDFQKMIHRWKTATFQFDFLDHHHRHRQGGWD